MTAALAAVIAFGPVPAHASEVLAGSQNTREPVVALTPDGVAYVAATSSDGASLFWRCSESCTTLAPGGLVSLLGDGSPASLATDTAGYVHLARLTSSGVMVTRSIDDGETWDRGTPLASPLPARASVLASGRFNSGLEGATLWAATTTDAGIVVTRSIDGGLTFTQASLARASGLARAIATDGDANLWIGYRDAGVAGVLHSADSGLTFTDTTLGAATEPPAIAVDASGAVLAAYTSGARVMLARSLDGAAWTTTATLDAVAARVRLATGPAGTSLAWQEPGPSSWIVRLAPVADGMPGTVTTVTTTAGPSLALATDASGAAHLVYAAPGGLVYQRM